MTAIPRTLGLVLAGGLARRMGGGDKARIEIGGVTILDRVLARLAPQCAGIIINANGDPGALCRYRAARWSPTTCRTSPARSPAFSPGSTGRRRSSTASNGSSACRATARSCPTIWWRGCMQARAVGAGVPLACARSGEWRHPVVGLWPVALRDDLRQALVEEDLRKIEVWTARHGVAIADWPDRADRSVLQRQHAGRCRASPRALRCTMRRIDAGSSRTARLFVIQIISGSRRGADLP